MHANGTKRLRDWGTLRPRIVTGTCSARTTADELAARLGTINYEIVTGIARRVPRIVVAGGSDPGRAGR